ncbi:class I SAM-dependent methyltransferase [Ralstonia insidiosa]|uniref:class I SAM-dependent methyltransferase n=1 Tax=Ralstonia TaxID=48736 RepID=UPI00040A7ABA|nr:MULTISPECIES: class I SAM-dependent methyltransferase [Ralstonia]MBY4706692.1 class I SAM-dependent methyltransferase [Ralstonia insidiosa]GAQ27761.1 putative SAM-dependent methyltransferase [Ralstonia sp. NT80]
MKDEDKAWTNWLDNFHSLYDSANYSSPLQSWMMRASHKLLERPFGTDDEFKRVLEIGAGTGAHLGFVRHRFDQYVLTDQNAKTLDVARHKLAGLHEGKLTLEVQAGADIAYPDNSFDRVVAAHVLEHIYPPHLAIKEWARVIKNGGVLSILIPTDPGLAWRLGRTLGPRRNALARGLAYDYIMAREHVNSCTNLLAILRHYFPKGEGSWWPLALPSVDINLFFAFHARIEKKEGKQ